MYKPLCISQFIHRSKERVIHSNFIAVTKNLNIKRILVIHPTYIFLHNSKIIKIFDRILLNSSIIDLTPGRILVDILKFRTSKNMMATKRCQIQTINTHTRPPYRSAEAPANKRRQGRLQVFIRLSICARPIFLGPGQVRVGIPRGESCGFGPTTSGPPPDEPSASVFHFSGPSPVTAFQVFSCLMMCCSVCFSQFQFCDC